MKPSAIPVLKRLSDDPFRRSRLTLNHARSVRYRTHVRCPLRQAYSWGRERRRRGNGRADEWSQSNQNIHKLCNIRKLKKHYNFRTTSSIGKLWDGHAEIVDPNATEGGRGKEERVYLFGSFIIC